MYDERNHPVTLAQSPFGMIQRCPCHAYYLTMGQINLHLSLEQFAGILELFNEALNKERTFRLQ